MIHPPFARGRRLLPTPLVAAVALGALALGIAAERGDLFPAFRFAIQWTPAALPSTAAVPSVEVLRGQPILSLWLTDEDLRNPERGLLANATERGSDWERPGSISYFDGGRLLFASGVGIRIHGGGSRITSERQSFRLMFRRRYGATEFPAGLALDPAARPLRHLVAHNDLRTDGDRLVWHFVNPLAYDIAKVMGAITPATRPVRFVLNGEFQGVYVLTERIDEFFLRGHFGHDQIASEQGEFRELQHSIRAARPLTMRKVEEIVDLENLTRWFLSVLFCATGDPYQGPSQFVDRTRPARAWFWLNWDMDRSFRYWDLDSYQALLLRPGEPPPGRNPAEPRPIIITDLLAGDPEYREYFKRVFTEVMNYRVTREFLEERYQHYLTVATTYGVEELDYLPRLREFLERRPAFLRALTEQWLNTPPSVALHLLGPNTLMARIDGFAVRHGFKGLYFPGTTIEVTLPPDQRKGFSHWLVNGQPASSDATVRLRIDEPTVIEAVFRDHPVHGMLASTETENESNLSVLPPADRPARVPVKPEIRWVRVPAGSFDMGCASQDEDCSSSERPRHRVTLEHAVELMDREVTSAQFRAFADSGGPPLPRQPWYATDDHPVVNVTWDEAQRFCASLGGRLPTEAEWERAARAGGDTPFPWGASFQGQANANERRRTDRWVYTAPVGQFAPNEYGLFDMAGNVWEWTADWYRENYDQPLPLQAPAPDTPAALRVIRGGSWDNRPVRLRASVREGLFPSARVNLTVGFRCARDPR